MSECVCGKCPSTFKFSDGENEKYLCLMDEKELGLERRICLEQLGKMCVFKMVNQTRSLTEKEKQFEEHTTTYWNARQKILDEEVERRQEE